MRIRHFYDLCTSAFSLLNLVRYIQADVLSVYTMREVRSWDVFTSD